jgi:hypothetical protein
MIVFQEQGRGALEHLLPRLPRNGKKATSTFDRSLGGRDLQARTTIQNFSVNLIKI